MVSSLPSQGALCTFPYPKTSGDLLYSNSNNSHSLLKQTQNAE